jgi:regulator of protease activity HflC (stomatin/prohibitin superfamily)
MQAALEGPTVRRALALGVVVILTLILAVGGCTGLNRTGPQEVAVVQNGGAFDDKSIRQVLRPQSSVTWTGWWSSIHRYPAGNVQRFYTITSDASGGDRIGVDVLTIPTSDGVRVGLESTIQFNFVGEADERLLRQFDRRFGVRTFPVPDSGEQKHPYDGDEGFGAFLDALVRPVIDTAVREAVGSFSCAELSPDCALATAGQGRRLRLDSDAGREARTNLERVQTSIAETLRREITRTLGAEYLRNIRVNVAQVRLPREVERAVNEVQEARTRVGRAEAEVRQARLQDRRNRILSRTYARSPILGQIDAIKAAKDAKAQVIITVGGRGPGVNIQQSPQP